MQAGGLAANGHGSRRLHIRGTGMPEAIALDDVAIFFAVAECESFVGAARRLHIPQSSVSRRVAALEHQIGALLLRRMTRSLKLTSEG